ncbi:hypothetical protein ACLB2K_036845 [Fragaria x ananassa]
MVSTAAAAARWVIHLLQDVFGVVFLPVSGRDRGVDRFFGFLGGEAGSSRICFHKEAKVKGKQRVAKERKALLGQRFLINDG